MCIVHIEWKLVIFHLCESYKEWNKQTGQINSSLKQKKKKRMTGKQATYLLYKINVSLRWPLYQIL